MAGASSYPRFIDFAAFREIADEVGAELMVDMAHIAGLVAAGVHPSPFGHAQWVSTTTHKTLAGPRGGAVFCEAENATKLDRAVFPGSQGGPLEHVIAGKAVCFLLAQTEEFREKQRRTVVNAAALAEELLAAGAQAGYGRHGQPHGAGGLHRPGDDGLARPPTSSTRWASPPTRTQSPATPVLPLSRQDCVLALPP